MKTPHHLTKLIAVIAAMLMLGASQASAFVIVGGFPVGVAFGQTARVNILNLADGAMIINGKFLDSDGNLLGDFREASVAPGKTMSFDLNRDTLSGTESRVQLHLLLEGEEAQLRRIRSSLEVFNNADGRTTAFLGGPGTFMDPTNAKAPGRAQ